MPQIINTNISSINAQNNLNKSQASLATSLQRLSSGLRINSAKDDAAGLAISTRMAGQIAGLGQASRNANDGISFTQTGDGALGQMADMLIRIRELAVQSANATNSTSDRQALNSEAQQLSAELDRFSTQTQFNGQNILDGTFSSAVFQVGANAGQTITATSSNFRTTTYGDLRVQGGQSAGVSGSSTSGAQFYASGSTISGQVSGAIIAQTITVNGSIGAATATVLAGDSAGAVANKVNALQSSTGVTATATTTADLVFSAAAGTAGTNSYSINIGSQFDANTYTSANVSFSLSTTGAAGTITGSTLSNVVTAINSVSATTGVTAALDATQSGVIITQNTGARIVFANTTSGIASGSVIGVSGGIAANNLVASGSLNSSAALVAGSGFIEGVVTYDSSRNFSTSASVANSWAAAASGVAAGVGTVGSLQSVSTIDITTVSGSFRALAIADAAAEVVNRQRASFGALQSRFDNTVSNLGASVENLSAAKSRILDADFAAETANLTRSQVLQQAGIAVLAQANAVPNNVLALLR